MIDRIRPIFDRKQYVYLKQFSWHYLMIFTGLGVLVATELLLPPRVSRPFRLDDARISKPYKENEIVPNSLCILLSAGLPMVVVFAVCVAKRRSWSCDSVPLPLPVSVRRGSGARSAAAGASANAATAGPTSTATATIQAPLNSSWLAITDPALHIFHCNMVHLWLSISLMAPITSILKIMIGNQRPDFLARCQPSAGGAAPGAGDLLGFHSCTNKNLAILYEGYKSTPSGHSSFIACGMAFLFQWLSRYLPTRRRWLPQFWCILLALVVMYSRVLDGRHHWYDVISGAIIGLGSHVLVSATVL
ncbi:phosphatidate phosphatase LPP1 Ecym_1062 [Eremothecium cymbalariae DBVPG|uniref:Phosphatidic acid phosphatase type 2/haloperoxidase domain-containing protein n=1 Tax=Eremothecium cymbalariae (strain CBS 270.75 / DBVPG 7215 / KCTC 17166 / NRRL Y-17582) TaxID=931890 RepID=G8JMB1_ERECY|nr:hypothetical protein Ecym_1062 [Eremothecium cymbalariae DBVPG\